MCKRYLNVFTRPTLYWGFGILIAAFVVVGSSHVELFDSVREDITMWLMPSAERAFAYGERHFDATNPALYDVRRANSFFIEAVAMNPRLPYVYHELARIS